MYIYIYIHLKSAFQEFEVLVAVTSLCSCRGGVAAHGALPAAPHAGAGGGVVVFVVLCCVAVVVGRCLS